MAPLAKDLEGRDITPRLADSRRAQRDAAQNRTAWLKLSMNIAHMYAWRWDRARAAFEFAVAEGHQGTCRAGWSASSRISAEGATGRFVCAVPRSCCARPPRMPRTPCYWSTLNSMSASSTSPSVAWVSKTSSGRRSPPWYRRPPGTGSGRSCGRCKRPLANTAKHRRASRVALRVQTTTRSHSLEIVDNGEGFNAPTAPYPGMGLKIVGYRAGMIGATCEIAPHEPRGTVVRITGEQSSSAAPSAGAPQIRSEA